MTEWRRCKKIVCIRPDNMGDIIMSGPALRALRETFNFHITLLTSRAGQPVTPFIPAIDNVITADLPWVKLDTAPASLAETTDLLKEERFDGAIIFSVYSQSAFPSAMLAYAADIPLRLGYARENPYQLLTHWVADEEPFTCIRHQVERDLHLVSSIGAHTGCKKLRLVDFEEQAKGLKEKIYKETGHRGGYIVAHPGVSENKRRYDPGEWRRLIQDCVTTYHLPVFFSGSNRDTALIRSIMHGLPLCYDLSGKINVGEWIRLIADARVLISVNTAAMHIASAVQCPVLVLYALTNPQHTPWMVPSFVFPFPVPQRQESKNQVIRFVNAQYDTGEKTLPSHNALLKALDRLLEIPCRVMPSGSIIDPGFSFSGTP